MSKKSDHNSVLLQDDLFKKGYIKIPIIDSTNINKVKLIILENLKNVINENLTSINLDDLTLENLHEYIKDSNINNLRTSLINKLNSINNFNELLFINPIDEIVKDIIGNDLLIQKGVNLVIQRPYDLDKSELHRDYPSNSEFELVVWIPFVDCNPNMSMYIVDLDKTKNYIKYIKLDPKNNWSIIKNEIEDNPNFIDIKFGEAIIFLTPVLHGSLVHEENTTRFSLNYRVKGLFSPSGMKDPFNFWKILRISNFTNFAINYEDQ